MPDRLKEAAPAPAPVPAPAIQAAVDNTVSAQPLVPFFVPTLPTLPTLPGILRPGVGHIATLPIQAADLGVNAWDISVESQVAIGEFVCVAWQVIDCCRGIVEHYRLLQSEERLRFLEQSDQLDQNQPRVGPQI